MAAGAVANPGATTPVIDPKEFESLKQQLVDKDVAINEARTATQYWHDKAQSVLAAKPAAPAAAAAGAEEEDVDLLDVISTGGVKGLEKVLAKTGYVKAADVDKKVAATVSRITREAKLATDYPDLNDSKSDFFKLTAAEFGRLKSSGVPEEMAMELAAQGIERQLLLDGKMKTPAQRKADDTAARKARAAAAEGPSGGGPAAGSEEDNELTADQLQICQAMGIDPEKYAERAKAGVNMAGKSAR